jgi:hypothetical protein
LGLDAAIGYMEYEEIEEGTSMKKSHKELLTWICNDYITNIKHNNWQEEDTALSHRQSI